MKILEKYFDIFGIEIIKPVKKEKMIFASTDLFQLMEVMPDGVTLSNVMNLEMMTTYVVNKFKDQPLQYFNEMDRLKLIHLKTGTIKPVKLSIEF